MDASYTTLRTHGKAADGEQERQLLRRLDQISEASARNFAAAFADHVLPIFEHQRPGDDRPRRAIEAARLFARGEMRPHDLAEVWSRARDVMISELRAVGGDALAAARAAAMCAVMGPGWSAAGAAHDTAYAAREAAAWARARAVAHESWGATDAIEREALREAIARAWAEGEAAEQSWQAERLLAYLTSDGLRPDELGPVEQPALAS